MFLAVAPNYPLRRRQLSREFNELAPLRAHFARGIALLGHKGAGSLVLGLGSEAAAPSLRLRGC